MADTGFPLKNYQLAGLDRLRAYLRDAADNGASVAFYRFTNLPYRDAPAIPEGTPYVCLRVPTGGGKTVMAAHSVGIAAQDFLHTSNPMVLWLVPSTPILDQTVAALKDPDHPYRAALAKDFGQQVSILTKPEALAMPRADAEGGACIIVSTIQSFRRVKPSGETDAEGLKVYQDAGSLMDHFGDLVASRAADLEQLENAGRPVFSLANVLRLHRPMVIVDEAHNARTPLSFDTLARFSPSLILELTATPQTEHDPSIDRYASNILHAASAAELKAEEMIKMPIKLTTDRDWQKTIAAACDCRAALEDAAKAEAAESGVPLRPLILFQAQSARQADPHRLTYDVIENHLIDERRIPAAQIAVHSGTRRDLDDHDIDDPECPIRYIVTVQKLKEGWDCPSAYVLCSVAEQVSTTAIEQILGRVLRMPGAKRKSRDALNHAYAYVASASFDETARQLRDGLVEGAGFNRLEADDIVARQDDLGFDAEADTVEHRSEPILDDGISAHELHVAISRLPESVQARVSFEPDTGTLVYRGLMSNENRNRLQLALAASPRAGRIVERLYVKSNGFQLSASEEEGKPPFVVPLLGIRSQGQLQLFRKEHFLNLPWNLDECDSSLLADRFRIVDQSQTGLIDVTEKGKVEVAFVKRLQNELALAVHEPAWTLPRLANWLDAGIPHPDVTKPSAILFISRALEALIEKNLKLEVLARNRFDLRQALSSLIADLRVERESRAYHALFVKNAEDFATHSDHSMIFKEESYAFNQPYSGATKFNKHYTRLIGDLKPSGEEFECAVHLDRMEQVQYWIRNVEGKRNSFWLQLPHAKFYPDFVAMLKDGRLLVVEYKGAHLYQGEADKRHIGYAWAAATSGKGLFCMPTDRKFEEIDDTVETEQNDQ